MVLAELGRIQQTQQSSVKVTDIVDITGVADIITDIADIVTDIADIVTDIAGIADRVL